MVKMGRTGKNGTKKLEWVALIKLAQNVKNASPVKWPKMVKICCIHRTGLKCKKWVTLAKNGLHSQKNGSKC